MQKIVSVEEMQALEAAADAQGHVSYAEMMELAGTAVAQTALRMLSEADGKTVLVLVGKGNNGGDGLVAARYLAKAGVETKVYALTQMPESALHREAVESGVFAVDAENDQRQRVLQNLVRSADLVIDALLGTGIQLPLRKNVSEVLRTVRHNLQPTAQVLAVDASTGIDLDTGAVDSHALAADVTVTFGAAKQGQFKFPAADYVGTLELVGIGWPKSFPELDAAGTPVLTMAAAMAALPKRSRNSHKGTFGTALVVAGSVNYAGAAYLAAAGAYRSGAGLVSVAGPAAVYPMLAANLPEATWLLLGITDGVISESAVRIVQKALPKAKSLLLGPGWGVEATTRKFLAALLAGEKKSAGKTGLGFVKAEKTTTDATTFELPPIVVDADGLKLLADIDGWADKLPDYSILTPHPGEMAVLTGLTTAEIQTNRIAIAQEYAQKWGKIVVLKGAFTVIATPKGEAVIAPFATAALATAGTGDILAGLIAGYLAQGVDPGDAACLGVYVHGVAGELAADKAGITDSVLAGDVLRNVGAAIRKIRLHDGAQLPTILY